MALSQCQKYTRMNRKQGRHKDGEHYIDTHNDISHANHEERYRRWAPPGNHNPGLEVKCTECGKVHEGSCGQHTERLVKHQDPPYGRCYICGDKSH